MTTCSLRDTLNFYLLGVVGAQMDLTGSERSSSWTPFTGARRGSRDTPQRASSRLRIDSPRPSPAPNLRNSVAHVFIRTGCNKWMFMYSITLSGASLLSPSMMGTQRCRPRLNTEDLSQALVGGALEHGSLRSYSRRGQCCSFALNYWYLFAWFLSDFQMCVHVQYFTFLSAEGRERPLWMFGARRRPRSS